MRLTVTDRAARLAVRYRAVRWLAWLAFSASPMAFPSPAHECLDAAVWFLAALWIWLLVREIVDEIRKSRRARRLAS